MRDDDEDAAPPLQPTGAPPRPPGASAAPEVLPWGACGVYNQQGELTEFPGERGVVRYVTSAVRFVQPPGVLEWRRSVAIPDRFEMKLEVDPATARSLASLRSDIEAAARAGRLDDPAGPLLKQLDAATLGLAELAGKLHRAGWSLGLVRPDNLFLLGGEVVPVDLGFTWQGMFGPPPWDDSPGRPAWLDPTVPYAWLYDHTPVRQQFAAPGNGVYPPASPAEDVRTLGRLIAWLISGHEGRELPVVRDAPPAWAVLEAAVGGKVATADALIVRLRADPPSGYFRRPEPEALPAPGRKSGWLLPVAAVAALGVCGATAWYFTRERDDKPVAVAPTPPLPPSAVSGPSDGPRPADPSPLAGVLKELDGTPAAERARLFDLLRKAYAPALAGAPAELKKARDAHRGRAIEAWLAAFQEADALAARPDQRLTAAARFAALQAELEPLVGASPATNPDQAAREKQCLEFVAARVRELSGPRP